MTLLNRLKYAFGLLDPEPELLEESKTKMAIHIAQFPPKERAEIVIHLIYSTLESLAEEREVHETEANQREKAIKEIYKHTNK
jgi:hypothetical protein